MVKRFFKKLVLSITTIVPIVGTIVLLLSSCAAINLQSISLDKKSLFLEVGQSDFLTPIFTSTNATNKNVAWSSNNNAIVTVDENGLVTAIAQGEAIITVTTEDGNKSAECKVTVKAQEIVVDSVTLNKTTLELDVNQQEQLTATVLPNEATNKNVTWESDNEEVATVDENGIVIAVSAGTATITATTKDGGYEATCIVTVFPTIYRSRRQSNIHNS